MAVRRAKIRPVKRTPRWIFAALLLVLASFAWSLGLVRVEEYARVELERLIARETDLPVRIGRLDISLLTGATLHDVTINVGAQVEAPMLHVDRASGQLRPWFRYTNQNLIRRLRLRNATLTLIRSEERRWGIQPVIRRLGKHKARIDEPEKTAGEKLLAPLREIEELSRTLLEKRLPFDRIEVVDSAIEVRDSRADALGSETHALILDRLQGRLDPAEKRKEDQLHLSGRIRSREFDAGNFAWSGRRNADGSYAMKLRFDRLDLALIAPHLRIVRPRGDIAGHVDLTADFLTHQPGYGRLAVDLLGTDLRSRPPALPVAGAGEFALPHYDSKQLDLHAVFDLSQHEIRVDTLSGQSGPLQIQLSGSVERPIRAASQATIALETRNVGIDDVRHALAWLPRVEREDAERLVTPVEKGSIALLRGGGSHRLEEWGRFLSGRSRHLPSDFVLDTHFEATELRVGPGDLVRIASGRLWWTGDRLVVEDARGDLNGSPLPRLDMTLDGVSNFIDVPPVERRIAGGTRPLKGLRAFWQSFNRKRDEESERAKESPPAIRLWIERLDHPMFLWPIARTEALVQPVEHGVHIDFADAVWGGVPVRGAIEWSFEPDEAVRAVFSARRPTAPRPSDNFDAAEWALGRFEVGAVTQGPWYQRKATGRFEASSGEVQLQDVGVDLLPEGRLTGMASLDLSQSEQVPYSLTARIEGGDMQHLADLIGVRKGNIEGRFFGDFDLTGRLDPREEIPASLNGDAAIEIRDGSFRQAIPAVLAIALKSELFSALSKRKSVRIDQLSAQLAFERGVMTTDDFTIEGPDVRALAAGRADIGHDPHRVDFDVVLFLFRPLDNLIDWVPVLDWVLLGTDKNMMAAQFRLHGPWAKPNADLQPLRSLASSGPAGLVTKTLPSLLRRGLEGIGVLPSAESETYPGPSGDTGANPTGTAVPPAAPGANSK